MFTIKSVHSRAVTTTLVALSNVHTNNDDLYAILSTVQKSTSWWRQFQEEAQKPKDDQADSEALEDEKPSDEQAASTSTSDKTATEAGADAEADQPAEAKSNAAAEASGSTSAADAAESTETIKEEPDDGAAESSSSSDTNNNNTSSSSGKQKKDKKNKKKGKKDSAKSSKADDDEAELEDDDSVVQSSDAAISDAALEKDDNIALLEQLPTMVSGHNRKIDMGIMNNVFMQLRKVANHSLLNRSIYQEEYVSSGTTVVPSHSIIDILVIPVFLPRLQSMSPTPASSKAMTNRRLLRN